MIVFVTPILAFLGLGTHDWSQLQGGPQRHGYSAEKVSLPVTEAWTRGFGRERVFNEAQPVVAEGKVFLGTAMGVFHAMDVATGKDAWTFEAAGPILGTAGVAEGKLIFGCMDGKVYALNAATGKLIWTFDSGRRTGFSSAVLLAESRVFIASRSGFYYALNRTNGSKVWETEIGAPILMSSAYDNGRIFLAATDMRARALDARSGAVLWKSAPLPGESFNARWPVAWKGHVLFRSYMVTPRGVSGGLPATMGPLPAAAIETQRAIVGKLENDPTLRSLFVLNQETGREDFIVPHWNTNTHNGTTCPPCVDGEGMLIVPVRINRAGGGWGRLDLEKRRVVEVFIDEQLRDENSRLRGTGNPDENMDVSAAGPLVFTFHTQERNAHFTGIWDQGRRKWTRVSPLSADEVWFNNNQSRENTPPVISGGMLFHHTCNTLNARRLTTATAKAANEPRKE